MKFLVDENISRSTIGFLRELGHDVKSVHDYQLTGVDDSDILRKALLKSRIIITHDLDFGNLIVFPVKYTGVIILRIKDQSPRNTNKVLDDLLSKVNKKQLLNSLVVISENNIRIRPL